MLHVRSSKFENLLCYHTEGRVEIQQSIGHRVQFKVRLLIGDGMPSSRQPGLQQAPRGRRRLQPHFELHPKESVGVLKGWPLATMTMTGGWTFS